jgi:DNA-binding transcriptional regulator YiaG
MPNHPNRARRTPSEARNPRPEEICRWRAAQGITQTEAAARVYTTCRVWQQWEAGDRKMHPAFWALAQIST